GAEFTESQNGCLGTEPLFVAQQPIVRWLPEQLAEGSVKLDLPNRGLIPDPIEQIGEGVRSNMTDSVGGICRVEATVNRVPVHPLTQPLSPILRLPLRPECPNDGESNHEKPNQHHINSSLSHHINMLLSRRPKARRIVADLNLQDLVNKRPLPTPTLSRGEREHHRPTLEVRGLLSLT